MPIKIFIIDSSGIDTEGRLPSEQGSHNDLTGREANDCHPATAISETSDKRFTNDEELNALTKTIYDSVMVQVGKQLSSITQNLSQLPLGIPMMWAGSPSSLPSGYLPCDGRALLVADYPELHQVIGRTFTMSITPIDYFQLPTMGGRFVVGLSKEVSDYTRQGAQGGAKELTLVTDNLPTHRHKFMGNRIEEDSPNKYAKAPGDIEYKVDGDSNVSSATDYYTSEVGANVPFDNRPPYIVMMYIIRVK